MANVLGELFGNIASAIREKTGDAGKMKPSEFPAKISGISVGAESGELKLILDQINGEVIGEAVYRITFVYGTELCTVEVPEGYDCADPIASGLIEKPKKDSTRYVNYTFSGWSLTEGGSANASALLNVDGDRTVYAAFQESYIYLAQGSCGNHMTGDIVMWTINPDYVVEISGKGWMENYASGSDAPWYIYKNKITEVVIAPGVTAVGAYAFHECTKVSSVTLSEGVQYIYTNAFMGTSVKKITLPYSMRWFQRMAVDYKTLESITLVRTDGWLRGNDSYSNGIAVTPEEAASSDSVLAILRAGVDTAYWWNEGWKEDAS